MVDTMVIIGMTNVGGGATPVVPLRKEDKFPLLTKEGIKGRS